MSTNGEPHHLARLRARADTLPSEAARIVRQVVSAARAYLEFPAVNSAVAEILRLAYAVRPLQLGYHEAGHVLVGTRLGRAISSVTVGQRGGFTHSSGPSSPLILLLMSLAGDRAERLTPECIENLADLNVGSQDQRDVDFALDVIGGDQLHRDFVLQDATAEVDKVLLEHRVLLDRLARILLERRTLDAYEVRHILGSRDSGGDWL